MGIREKLNQNPAIGIVLVVIVLAIMAGEFYHFMGTETPSRAGTPSARSVYFSADDGASFFADSDANTPPFDHNGKQAVRAYVFTVNGKTVIGYLEKHSTGPDSPLVVKKPGAGSKWVDASDPQANAIKSFKGPGGVDLTAATPPSD